jgi:nucleotide-binding universal stress UspA family protein
MFKVILVPVDGSKHALKAVDVAADLAQKYAADLLLLSVFRHISNLESTHSLVKTKDEVGSAEATLRDLAREVIDEALARARERGAGKIETFVKRGQPARTIVAFAKSKGADVIIMGSRGLGDMTGLLLGSVSHKVSSLADCTCITVK